jgi:hypothetical protein
MESREGVAPCAHALLPHHSPLGKTPHKTRVVGDGLLAAARALIQMTAQRRRAATLDGSQHAKMLPAQSGSILIDEVFARCSNDVGHLEGWRVHLLCSLRERFTCLASENSALSMGVPVAFR